MSQFTSSVTRPAIKAHKGFYDTREWAGYTDKAV